MGLFDLLSALTVFDCITPVVNTAIEASHGFGGYPIIVDNAQDVEKVTHILRRHGCDFWAAEMYSPLAGGGGCITVSDDDFKDRKKWFEICYDLGQAGIEWR